MPRIRTLANRLGVTDTRRVRPPAKTADPFYLPPEYRRWRYQKTVVGTVTSYVNAGDELIADYDDDGSLTYRYVPGPAVDRPIARVSSAGTVNYFHADRQGSVIAMSDSTGAVTEGLYTYDAYGNSATTDGVAFRYTGRRLDPETGQYYYRARYYSPALGFAGHF